MILERHGTFFVDGPQKERVVLPYAECCYPKGRSKARIHHLHSLLSNWLNSLGRQGKSLREAVGIVADAFDTIYEAENVTFLVYGSRDPAPNGAIRLLRDGGRVRDLGPQPREASVKLWVQDGLIALGRDARLSLFALFEVLALVVYRVQDILLREDTPRQVALNSSVHFALTILWDAAHAVYGREQGSLFVTAMFHRIFGHYPTADELYYRYIDLPNLNPPEDNVTLFSPRVRQFVKDLTSKPRSDLIHTLDSISAFSAGDCMAVLRSPDAAKTSRSLTESFDHRLAASSPRFGGNNDARM